MPLASGRKSVLPKRQHFVILPTCLLAESLHSGQVNYLPSNPLVDQVDHLGCQQVLDFVGLKSAGDTCGKASSLHCVTGGTYSACSSSNRREQLL